jgi:hypothetical protein
LTYSLGDIGLLAETTVDADGIVVGNDLNTLSTSDISICRIVEQRRDKSGCASEVAGIVGTVQNVVLKNRSDSTGVTLNKTGNSSIIEEFLDGIVAWSQDGDIPKTAKVSKKTGLSPEKA